MSSAPALGALALAVGEAAVTAVPSVPIHGGLLVAVVSGKLGFLARLSRGRTGVFALVSLLDGVLLLHALNGEKMSGSSALVARPSPQVGAHLASFGLVCAAVSQCALVVLAALSSKQPSEKTSAQDTEDLTSAQLAALEPPVNDNGYYRRPTPKFSDTERLDPIRSEQGFEGTPSQDELVPQESGSTAPTTPALGGADEVVEPVPGAALQEHPSMKEVPQQDPPGDDGDEPKNGSQAKADLDTAQDEDSARGKNDGPALPESLNHGESANAASEHASLTTSSAVPDNTFSPPEGARAAEHTDLHPVEEPTPLAKKKADVHQVERSASPTAKSKHAPPSAFKPPNAQVRPSTKIYTNSMNTASTDSRPQHVGHVSFDHVVSQTTDSTAESANEGSNLTKRHTSGNLRKLRLSFGRRPSGEGKTHHLLGALRHRTVSRASRQSEDGDMSNAASEPSSPDAKRNRRSSRVLSLVRGDRTSANAH